MEKVLCFIESQWQAGEAKAMVSFNPASAQPLAEGGTASPAQVRRAVQAAAKAFPSWFQQPLKVRQSVLRKMAELLSRRADERARLISEETGKPLWESRQEVQAMIRKVDLTIQAYDERCPVRTLEETPGERRTLIYHPLGVFVVLGPFNLPAHLPHGHMAPAVLAGNCVVFKPSELAPVAGQQLVADWLEAGLPPGVIQLVQGDAETSRMLVREEGVAGVLFTGGLEAGLSLHRALAGRPDIMLALEMGGNNPLIVDDPDDEPAACRLAVASSCLTAGQRCSCARRLIIVESSVSEDFIGGLREQMTSLRIGSPDSAPEVFMGPLITSKARDRVLAKQNDCVAKGGDMIVDAAPIGDKGFFLSPGLVDMTESREGMADEEVFGPFLQILRVKDWDAALTAARKTRFGLCVGLFSRDRKKYESLLGSFPSGIINWNRPTTGANSALPFGGVGMSGNFRPAGYFSVDYCAYPVASLARDSLLPEPAWPGMGEKA